MRKASRGMLWAAVALGLAPAIASAAIDLELRLLNPNPHVVGGFADIDLFAVWDGAGTGTMAAGDIMFTWDPTYLEFDVPSGGKSDDSGHLLISDFPTGPGQVNDAAPPTTGNGHYRAFAYLGSPLAIAPGPGGTRLTTFFMNALAVTPGTPVSIVPSIGSHNTVVYDGMTENLNVTGTLGSTTVIIVPEPGALALLAAAMMPLCLRRRRVA